MWPPTLHDELTRLADTQQYEALWRTVLSLCFPLRTGFHIAKPKDRTDRHQDPSRTLLVTHRLSADTFCVVTWALPSKNGLRGDPHRLPGYNNFFKGERVLRFHSAGTHLSVYETSRAIRRRSRILPGLYYKPDSKSFNGGWDSSANFDIDILEPLGMNLIVSSVCRARDRIGMSWDSWPQDLGAYAPLQSSALKYHPLASPSPPAYRGLISSRPSVQKVLGRRASSHIPRVGVHLPLDVVSMIISHLEPRQLSSFALASTTCNGLAERLLWRSFRIHGQEKSDVLHATARINALLRLPHRARYVQKLTIGPCDWAWNAELLEQLPKLWKYVPRLQSLLLEKQLGVQPYTKHGDEFSPVIRSLVTHGHHLCLQTFRFDGWMRPGSHLHQFLAGQTHLKHLDGVDMFASRPIAADDTFLPSLRTLVCDNISTACSLLPRRPVGTLRVKEWLSYDQLQALSASIAEHNSSLTSVTLNLSSPYGGSHPPHFLVPLLKSIPFVRRLVIGGHGGGDEDALLLSRLPCLEDLTCAFYPRPWDDAAKAEWLASCSPNLKRVVIWPEGVWVRNQSSTPWYLITLAEDRARFDGV